MTNVVNGADGCYEELYNEDGPFGDKPLTNRTDVATAWPIIRDLLCKCILSSISPPFSNEHPLLEIIFFNCNIFRKRPR